MKKIKSMLTYFTITEIILWSVSVITILVFFLIFDRINYLTLLASLIGVTSLIFCAKGNPIGQVLMIIFSVLYGIISFTFSYYGEMITYLGMTMPMAVFSLVSWLKNPYKEGKVEVKVNKIKGKEVVFMFVLSAIVTAGFYFVLVYFNTANILPSTLSITTSFIASYLTFRRNDYYAIAYATNDIILIWLWILATITNISYLSVAICFLAFLVNDIYGFISWSKMKKRQNEDLELVE